MIRSRIQSTKRPMGKQSTTTPSPICLRLLLALSLLMPGSSLQAQSANIPLLLPSSLTYDSSGSLYFAEMGNHVVRRLTSSGVVTIFAGTGTQGFGGDLGPATAALLDSPSGLALDGAGDLFIADTHNHRIRRVDAVTGIISTYASASLPVALAFNPQGALVVADAASHQVLVIASAMEQGSVVAGNGLQGFSGDGDAATAASLDTPSGIAFDSAGDLYIADAHNHRVRRVDAVTGLISTVGGTGQPGFSGDGSAAANAQMDLPRGISFDAAGNLLIADSRNQRIRRVDVTTGVMTTIAGDGTQGFLGDGTSALTASLDTPRAVVISPGALTTVADSGNNRVRQVQLAAEIQTIAGVGAVSPARAASTTVLTQSSSTTVAATVSAAGGAPSGTVALVDGTTSLASSGLTAGSATFSVSSLSVGTHTLTAAYAGNATLLPSNSAPLVLIVGSGPAPDFTLTATAPTNVTTVSGSAATFNFAIALTGAALTSPINLAVAGAPSGAVTSFSPALIPPPSSPASFTLTIDTPASAKIEQFKGRELTTALVIVALLVPLAAKRRRRSVWLLGLLLLSGCGARVNTGNHNVTPPVSYNLTISATATSPNGATLLHTAQVTLVVD